MKKKMLLILLFAVALAGLTAEMIYLAPSSTAPRAIANTPPEVPRRTLKPGDTFEIDAADLRVKLSRSTEDERPEQIADWVVYSTLLYTGVPGVELRDSLYDRPPMRLPVLEESVNFDYGPGRRVVMADKSVWLFRSATDPHPRATIARLADQVRMELGEKPESFAVFTYTSMLTDGVIEVRRDDDVTAAAMYSPEYGYVETKVTDLDGFNTWLEQIDDVVHVRKLDDQTIELGGRRMADARTEGVTLEYVASLYQGHRRIGENHVRFDPEANGDALVYAINSNVNRANNQELLDIVTFAQSAGVYAAMLDDWAQTLAERGYDTTQYRLSESAIAEADSVDEQKAIYELATEHTKAMYPMLLEAKLVMPAEPGFSLDPLWNGAGLIADLESLLADPQSLVAETYDLAAVADRHAADSRPILMTVATEVTESAGDGVEISEARRAQIVAATDALRGHTDTALSDGPIVPLLELKHELNQVDGEYDLESVINYILTKHHCQCARYDGPMQGTLVGMNLFYTDLLAKLWASVDYRSAAPVVDVVGFRSGPRVMSNIAPTYWKEMWEKPNTRLWFGPKKEGYARSEDSSEVNFAHIATRVYSAGSNDRKPGVEEAPSERARQVFHWWDRHFERVADHEQQYHTQNQIMKWSVITGWASTNRLLQFLDDSSIPIQRDLRFDHWYAANDSLRFRGDVRMLPDSRWRGGTECMEILRSYLFEAGGYDTTFIEGGVSLGGPKTLADQSAAVAQRVAPTMRRAGLTFDNVASGGLRNFKATQFEMPAGTARTIITPKTGNFLRNASTEFRVAKFETELIGGAEKGAFRIAADGHELGRLTFRNVDRGVQLAWRDAPAEFAERVTKLTARVHSGELPLVERNVYFIEAQNGKLETIGRAADAAEPRAFVVGAGEPPPNAFVEAGYGLRGEHRVGATFIEIAEADRRLASQAWQRVAAGDGGMTRVFTNNGPSLTAKPLKLRSSAGVEIEAFSDGNVVFLRRSDKYANFESLVEREGMTPEFVQALVQDGKSAATPAASQSTGIRAASAAERGDVSEAMAQLSEAAKKGSFDDAMRDFSSRYGNESLAGLTGDRARLALDYTAIRGTDADACIRRALLATEKRDLARAAQELTQAAGRGGPSQNVLQFMRRMPESPDLAVVRRLAQAADDGATAAFLKQVRVQADKRALHTIANVDGARVRVIDGTEKTIVNEFITATGEPIYIDRRLLTRYDWDGSPGASLHQAMKDPNVIWERIAVDGMGGFRPSQIMHEQTAAVAIQTTSSETASLGGAGRGASVFRLRYQPCQEDDPRSECKQAA